LKISYLTYGFTKSRGGPTLLFNFARAVKNLSNASVEFHTIEDRKIRPRVQVVSGVNTYFHQLAEPTLEIGTLKSLFKSLATIVADTPYAGVLDSFSFFHIITRLGPLRYSSHPRDLVELIKMLSLRSDILHMGAATMPYVFLSATSKHERAKLVVHALFHPPFRALLDNISLKKLIYATDAIYWRSASDFIKKYLDAITTSTPYEMEMFKALGCSKTFFVGEGVDLCYLEMKHRSTKPLANNLRERLGRPLVLYVGARNLQKGYYHTLLAFEKLIKSGFKGRLICIGKKAPVPSETVIKISSHALKAEERLKKDGFLIDFGPASEDIKFAAMQASDVIVLPSYVETIPLVFLEAWYFKKPAVGFRIPTLASVIKKQGEGAFLVECGNIESLAETISFITSNQSYATEVGEEGSKKLKVFNLVKCAERLIKVYTSIE